MEASSSTLVQSSMSAMHQAGDDRLAARLTSLPHNALVEVLVASMTEGRAAAEACIAKHLPLSKSTIEVLLSRDLLPHVFASLEMTDGAAAAVCTTWQQAWRDTDDGRRGLRVAEPFVLYSAVNFKFVGGHPSGKWLAFNHGDTLCFLDSSLNEQHLFKVYADSLCVGNGHLYCGFNDEIERFDGDTFERSSVSTGVESDYFESLAAGGGLLFAGNCSHEDGADHHCIVVFDAQTLATRRRFGGGLLYGTKGIGIPSMQVVEEALYVNWIMATDDVHSPIHVFSFSGELLRSIRGDWRLPQTLVYHNDRLYVSECSALHEKHVVKDVEAGKDPEAGKRVFVLTPQGETLQVWKTPEPRVENVYKMAVFGRNLVVLLERGSNSGHKRLVALKGV